MEKFKNLLPHGLVLSYVIKMLVITPSFADAAIILVLGFVLGLKTYLEKNFEIQDIKIIVAKQSEVIQAMAVEIAKVKTISEVVKLKGDFANSNVGGMAGINKRVG